MELSSRRIGSFIPANIAGKSSLVCTDMTSVEGVWQQWGLGIELEDDCCMTASTGIQTVRSKIVRMKHQRVVK